MKGTQKRPKRKTVSYAIRTNDIVKKFDDLVAVCRLNLGIKKGTLYGLIGPNGSGKTTTIKILMGLLRPTSGSATILGEQIPVKRNLSRIGYMPQEMALYLDMTVYENLQLFAELYSVEKDAFRHREEELLRIIGLEDRRDSLVSQLSGGMKHRVSLACTLVHDPDILFLDEPTVGVDPELRVGFWGYFSKLRASGKTIVMTTHYMDEARRCDVVGMMRQGRLIAEGSPDDLMAKTATTDLEQAYLMFAREECT